MTQRAPAIGFIFVTLLIDVIGFGIIIPGDAEPDPVDDRGAASAKPHRPAAGCWRPMPSRSSCSRPSSEG